MTWNRSALSSVLAQGGSNRDNMVIELDEEICDAVTAKKTRST